MAENVNEKLFSEFAPNTTQEWKDKVIADLKGADIDKKLVWRTNEGFNVQPMFRLEDMKDLKNLECFPGEYPFVRGNKKNNNECAKESRPASGYAGKSPKIIYERTVCRSCTNGRR